MSASPPRAAETPDPPPAAVVVSSDPALRRQVRAALEGLGGPILEAESTERIPARTPPVILLDTRSDDGIAALLANPDGPFVIALAANEQALEGCFGVDSLGDGALAECHLLPIRPLELRLRVANALARHRDRSALADARAWRAEQAHMWEAIRAFAHRANEATDLDALLQALLETASEMTGARRVSVMLPDADATSLVVAAAIGLDDVDLASVRVPIGDDVAGRAFDLGCAILDEPATMEGIDRYGCRTFASLLVAWSSMNVEQERIGVLNLTDRPGDRPFDAWEIEFIDLLADIGGSAIHDLRSRRDRDEAREAIVHALATLAEYRDDDTGHHVERVTRFSLLLAEALRAGPYAARIDDVFLAALRRAAPLHDIGKVAIPDAILLKPGRLTDAEMAVMRRHSAVGRDAIRAVAARCSGDPGFLRMAEEITGSHHERWDGAGYPEGLAGEAIPLAARIVSVADVYDAVTSARVYKAAMSHDEAWAIIDSGAGTQFDPVVVEAFRRVHRGFARLSAELRDRRRRAA